MAVDKEVLNKAIRNLAWALPLMFIGPSVIYNAFINKHSLWHYLVLAIGIGVSLGAVYLLFRGVQLIVKSLFDGNDD